MSNVVVDESVIQFALDTLLRVQPQIRGAIPVEDVEWAITMLKKELKNNQIVKGNEALL